MNTRKDSDYVVLIGEQIDVVFHALNNLSHSSLDATLQDAMKWDKLSAGTFYRCRKEILDNCINHSVPIRDA